jgi:hypothetical protein
VAFGSPIADLIALMAAWATHCATPAIGADEDSG